MSAVSVYSMAVSLSRQGVHQDKEKNYAEAARCYREAIAAFASVRCKSADAEVAATIDEKVTQYRDRLRKIDEYLLSKADLSGLFKSAVDFHRGGGVAAVPSSRASVNNGLQIIERAKRKDAKKCYEEAVELYEEGMAKLLEAAVAEQSGSPECSERLRFKCLLVHERVDSIRSHLESGVAIDDRANKLNSSSCGGFDSCSASPEPLGSGSSESLDEDHMMLMEEIRSSFSFQGGGGSVLPKHFQSGSSHSLYPTCEIKRQPSVVSGNSDFLGLSSGGGGDLNSSRTIIPLANIDQELTISSVSLKSSASSSSAVGAARVERIGGVHSVGLSPSSSVYSLHAKYRSVDDVVSGFSSSRDSSFESAAVEEKDRNVTELTYVNQMLDPSSGGGRGSPCGDGASGGGSDSGISDPCSTLKRRHRDDSSSATPPLTPTIFLSDDDNTLSLSDEFRIVSVRQREALHMSKLSLDDGIKQSGRRSPFRQRRPRSVTPTMLLASLATPPRHETQVKPLCPKPETAERKPPSPRPRKVQISDSADELRVISSEEVVDVDGEDAAMVKSSPLSGTKLKVDDAYSYGAKEAYVPARAFARRNDGNEDDEGVNKGCYYLMSCLDAFWIL